MDVEFPENRSTIEVYQEDKKYIKMVKAIRAIATQRDLIHEILEEELMIYNELKSDFEDFEKRKAMRILKKLMKEQHSEY